MRLAAHPCLIVTAIYWYFSRLRGQSGEPDMIRNNSFLPHPNLQDVHATVLTLLSHLQHIDLAAVDADVAARLGALLMTCKAVAALPTMAAPLPVVDRAVFDRLLDLAGPETSRDLLDRLAEDLIAVQHQLQIAGAACDWHTLRAQSHILIGLSGAIGADTLRRDAQHLNDLAHTPAPQKLQPLLAQLAHPLNALIRFVQAERANASLPA